MPQRLRRLVSQQGVIAVVSKFALAGHVRPARVRDLQVGAKEGRTEFDDAQYVPWAQVREEILAAFCRYE